MTPHPRTRSTPQHHMFDLARAALGQPTRSPDCSVARAVPGGWRMAALVTRRATRQGEGGMDDAVIVLLSIAATLVGFAGFMFICINCCHNVP